MDSEQISHKIHIAKKCKKILENTDKMTDEIMWQIQYHKGYIQAMNEVLSDLVDEEKKSICPYCGEKNCWFRNIP